MTSNSGEHSLTELWQRLLSALESVAIAILDSGTTMDQFATETERLSDAGAALQTRAGELRDRDASRLDVAFVDLVGAPLARMLGEEERAASASALSVALLGKDGMRFVGDDEQAVLGAAAEWFGRHPQRVVLAMSWHCSEGPDRGGAASLTVFTDVAGGTGR